MAKFRPPSWAAPEPGEDTIEIEYTDGSTTKAVTKPELLRLVSGNLRRVFDFFRQML